MEKVEVVIFPKWISANVPENIIFEISRGSKLMTRKRLKYNFMHQA